MTILITGSGIVGCQIARQLVEAGETPVLYDLAPVPAHIGSVVSLDKVRIVQGDVSDFTALANVCRQHAVTKVVHTAAMLTGPSNTDPSGSVRVNIGGSVNCLELARQGLVGRVVLAGSTTVTYGAFGSYGEGTSIPENFQLKAVEQAPSSFYSATKLAMEMMAGLYRKTHKVDCVVVRYGAVIGAWSGPNIGMIARMISNVLTPTESGVVVIEDPLFVWSGVEEFIDARDCASGTIAALTAGQLQQHVYTISNDQAWSMEQFLAVVAEVCPGLKFEQRVTTQGGIGRFPHARRAVSDISAAARDLNWRPLYSLRESLTYFAGITKPSHIVPTTLE